MTLVAMIRHSVLLSVMVMALVLATSTASAPRKSSQDQYEQRGDQAQTETDGHKPLIHRVQLNSTGLHRFGLIPPALGSPPELQELQVGCGDGSVNVRTKPVASLNNKRSKRDTENKRERRDYIHWIGASSIQNYQPTGSQFQPYPPAQNVFQPVRTMQPIQAQAPTLAAWHPAPYYIPIWGNPRTVPVFFPSKTILFNPGYPMMNRPRPKPAVQEPVFSTEAPPVTASPGDTTIQLMNKFGGENEETDNPSWGFVESEEVAASPLRTTTQRPIATRRPSSRPSGRRPAPPLMHSPSRDQNEQQSSNSQPINLRPVEEQPVRVEELPNLQVAATISTPQRVPAQQLNRCVWAIISCCNPTNQQIKYNCFENLGCPGAFWDSNPCSKEVTQAAVNAAQEFYNRT